MQGHHVQNIKVVGVQFPSQEDLQFLKCRTEPETNIYLSQFRT